MAVTANYETVMIISMKKGEEGIQAIVEKFKALIEKHATLKNVDEWGKRKLAYLINKESEGYYVLFDFESEAEFPAELDRIYKITEGVMRSMIIKKSGIQIQNNSLWHLNTVNFPPKYSGNRKELV